MKKILFILLSFCLAAEMEVDGNLKVTGTVDANGNPITNVGPAISMTDAINGNVLQSALRDDGVYEYEMYYVGTWVGHFWNDDNYIQNSIYKSIDLTDTGEGWGVKLNTLSSEGWKVLSIIPYGIEDRVFSEISQQQDWGFISLFVLQRPIQE